MATGTVKWFNTSKGFGFIQPESGGKDVFVNITAVQAAGLKGLNDGQRVSYEVQMERGKESAGNLKLASRDGGGQMAATSQSLQRSGGRRTDGYPGDEPDPYAVGASRRGFCRIRSRGGDGLDLAAHVRDRPACRSTALPTLRLWGKHDL